MPDSSPGLKTDLPVVLLPVRLETRTTSDDKLLVRIYPDQVHIDSFEPTLTEAEVTWGKHFWEQTWVSYRDEALERSAWAQLAEHFGSQRAAWIAERLTPTNVAARPSEPPQEGTPAPRPDFPRPRPSERPNTEKPNGSYVRALPDYWIARGYVAKEGVYEKVFEKVGAKIKEPLAWGFALDQEIAPEKLKTDPDTGWRIDFAEAEKAGMSLTIDYKLPSGGLDLLLVFGVKPCPEGAPGRKALEDLFRAHRYTEGLAFVAQGTPSNNTATNASGYRSSDPGFADSYATERKPAVGSAIENSNRDVMARAFGVDDSFFAQVAEANATEQSQAAKSNAALWESTWGYFLKHIMAGDKSFSEEAIAYGREHFEAFVRGRGPLPAVRIGNQPYGLLPVISLDGLLRRGGTSMDASLVRFLYRLRDIWQRSLEYVPRVGEGRDPQESLLHVVARINAMTPVSVGHFLRRAQRVELRSSCPGPRALDSGSTASKDLATRLGIPWIPGQIRTVFSSSVGGGQPLFDPGTLPDSLKGIINKSATAAASPVGDELLARETLDLCSHRYDAWVTSFASKRLHELRGQSRYGLYLGGYGWIENLKKAPARSQAPAPAGDHAPLYRSDGNQGFVHAPSLAHATTAALLRSGYVSNRSSALDEDRSFAVNLSSERVRLAEWLLDGVRQGQPLGALLGYRFERGLHENRPDGLILDGIIRAFRLLAPLEVREGQGVSPLSANLVVDGLALLSMYKASLDRPDLLPWGKEGLPLKDSLQGQACIAEIKNIDDAVDAIADLVLAESVHQVAQGRPVQAGAALAAITRGEAAPPELDVIRTPRTGVDITHRIAVVFSGAADRPAWGAQTVRSQAEPHLNAWAAQILGSQAEKAMCRVEYLETTSGNAPDATRKVLGATTITLDKLELSPLDLLCLVQTQGEEQFVEVRQRVSYCALRDAFRPADVPGDSEVHATFERGGDWQPHGLTFAEVLEAARAASGMMKGARALEAMDLAPPGTQAPAHPQDAGADLHERAEAAMAALQARLARLKEALQALPEKPEVLPDASRIENLREAMIGLAGFGIRGAVPLFPADDTLAALRALRVQAQSVRDEAEERRKQAAAIDQEQLQAALTGLEEALHALPSRLVRSADQENKENSRKIEKLQSRMKAFAAFGVSAARPLLSDTSPRAIQALRLQAQSLRDQVKTKMASSNVPLSLARLGKIFGEDFRVLPQFSLADPGLLATSLRNSTRLQGGDPLASVTWLHRVARVREGAARLNAAMVYAEALNGPSLQLHVAQLPYDDSEQWAALQTPVGSRLSLVVRAPFGIDVSRPLSGLLIDEWVEVIPSNEETTGLTFHFDAPGSRAPQAVLLAVAPDNVQTWSLDDLADVLRDTLELAKLRTIDLTALVDVGQFLPAIYLPDSTGNRPTS